MAQRTKRESELVKRRNISFFTMGFWLVVTYVNWGVVGCGVLRQLTFFAPWRSTDWRTRHPNDSLGTGLAPI
jgi:hypothetical protein